MDRDALAGIPSSSAEEGGVEEGRAIRGQLGDEGVGGAVVGGVERPGRGGEVGRGGDPDYVGVARTVDRDAATEIIVLLFIGPAEEGRVDESRAVRAQLGDEGITEATVVARIERSWRGGEV